ncbi:MAG TPA: chemotaxis protein CheB, partial [Chitinophagales bacterium]|nr:chemotaxis protein CheB [Chitinophagales bacterium]
MIQKKTAKPSSNLFIAAIGASAGGLDALQKLVSDIPEDVRNVAFVIVQHLSPSYKSMLVPTLSNQTKLEVIEAKDGMTISPCKIYVTPPDREISIKNSKLHLRKSARSYSPHPSIDGLFISLAEESKMNAIGVVLSGTGTDGADGVRAIKDAGGIVMVQSPRSAKYDSMPQAAIETGKADFILPPDKIAQQVAAIIGNAHKKQGIESIRDVQNHEYEEIIDLLSRETGTDFTNYKLKTLYRRINKRVGDLGLNSLNKYVKYIEKNQTEIEELFYSVLIGVTSFFREPAVFKALEKHLSAVIDAKENNMPVRIWLPGCATGEEAYTIAIIVAGLLKKKKRALPVQIFGTDINEHALNFARKGVYTNKALQYVPQDKLKEYFVPNNECAEVSKSLRSMVLFSRHDLTHNPPFLKLDLIICRNLLIYFNSKLQEYVFPVFFSALAPKGILLLGKSEGIGRFTDLYTPLNREAKIFQRKAGTSLQNIRYTPVKSKETFKAKAPDELSVAEMVKETIYKIFPYPYVVINDNADIKEISGDVSRYLGLKQGQMNANLFRMAHENLKIELRSLVNKAIKEDKEASCTPRKLNLKDKSYKVKITVRPLLYAESPNQFYMVVFQEVEEGAGENTRPVIMEKTGNANRIKELEQELDATKEDLQSFIERLESANTEFQTINEELQSSNEELKISNEELETTNEELQSANEEINIAYAELKTANIALEKQENLLRQAEINAQALLNNNLQSFILIDEQYKIVAFNQQAITAFREISSIKLTQGADFRKLLTQKELAPFEADFKKSLKGNSIQAERIIVSKRGKAKTFLFNFTPVGDESKKAKRISFGMLDISDAKKTTTELGASEKLIESFFYTTDIGIAVVDEKAKMIKVNEGFCKLLNYSVSEVTGKSWFEYVAPAHVKAVRADHNKVIAGKATAFERQMVRKDGVLLDLFITNKVLLNADGSRLIIKTVRDITESKKYKDLLQQAERLTKIGAFEIEAQSGKVTWTDEMFNIFEADRTYIPTISRFAGFYSSKDRKECKERLEGALMHGKQFDVVRQIKTVKGNIKWVHILGIPVLIKPNVYKLVGTVQDITTQKQNEQEIERLSWVASHTNNSVIITDNKGLISWVNGSFERMTGYKLSEVIGRQPGQLLQGKGTNRETAKKIEAHLRNLSSCTGEILLNYTKKGEPLWLSLDLSPIFKEDKHIGFVGIMTDITQLMAAEELKKSQLALLAKQKLFNAIAKYFPNGIIGIINKNLRYVFVGGTELKKLGLSHHNMIGDLIFDKIHSASNQVAEPFLKNVFKNENVSFEVTVAGNIYSVIAVPINELQQPVSQALVVIQNITKIKESEAELITALNQQKELSAMKSKFVSIASHEFRTPLSTILSSAFLAGKYNKPEDVEKRERHLERIKTSVGNLTDILNDFLSVGKIEEGAVRNKPVTFK